MGTLPKILNFFYDSNTYTATIALSKPLPAAVFDLTIFSNGVVDREAANLDGEWLNGITTGNSGNATAGGDFSFRIFALPGDSRDESGGVGTRTVNSNDSQKVRDKQNGIVVAGFGDFGYDARADLDGSAFINAADSQYVRDQQNAIIFRSSGRIALQNPANRRDVDNDGTISPLDVLIVINALNKRGEGEEPPTSQDAFLDVTGDEDLSPLDALVVINWLNGDTTGDVPFETGEGEKAADGTGEGEAALFEDSTTSELNSRTSFASAFWTALETISTSDKEASRNFYSRSSHDASLLTREPFQASPAKLEGTSSRTGVDADACFAEEFDLSKNSDELDLADTLDILAHDVLDHESPWAHL